MMLRLATRILWGVVLLFGILGLTLFFFTIFDEEYFSTSFEIDIELASKFGDYFGGFIGTLFAMTSTFLILVTLMQQNIDNKKRQAESNFFKMLDYHSENVKQLNVSHIDPKKKEHNIEGRRAFIIFKIQLTELFEVVKKIQRDLKLDLSDKDLIDIVYVSFYYGIDGGCDKSTENKFLKYKRGDEIYKSLLKEKGKHSKRIGRTNQTSLSGYFRNLYNAIKFIDSDKHLTAKEKKRYIKILRAQLSNPELYVLFFNVVSRFGKKWEENKYIERYELVKNIPLDYLGICSPKDFFPMEYEEDEIN